MIAETLEATAGLAESQCLWRRKRWLVAATAQVKLSPTKQETRPARVGIPSPSGDWEDVKSSPFPARLRPSSQRLTDAIDDLHRISLLPVSV